MHEAAMHGVHIVRPQRGYRWTADGVTFDILAPSLPVLANTGDDINENSIVAMLRYHAFHELFMGDAGNSIDFSTAPPSVRLIVIQGLDIGNYAAGAPNGYFAPARAMPTAGTGALLTARKRHMRTLRTASMGRAEYYEGSDLDHLYNAFDLCEQNRDRPKAIATALLDLLGAISTGLTSAYRKRIDASLKDDRVDYGHPHAVKPVIDALAVLYEVPNIFGPARVCCTLLSGMPAFLTVVRPAALRILSALVPGGKRALRPTSGRRCNVQGRL